MVLLEVLTNSYQTFNQSVRPEVTQATLSPEARYNLAYICTQIMGVSTEVARYHSGLNLLFDARQIWSHLIEDTLISDSLFHHFETDLAQTKLSVTTGNA